MPDKLKVLEMYFTNPKVEAAIQLLISNPSIQDENGKKLKLNTAFGGIFISQNQTEATNEGTEY